MSLLYPDGYPDPFAHYAELLPGQPAAVLDTFACRREYPPPSLDTYLCGIHPEDALIFSRIQVLIYNDRIARITFYGSGLQVVDLIQHFGRPSSITVEEEHYILWWEDGTYALIPITARRYTYQLRVLFVTVKANWSVIR
jgi:hypothetical protein